MFTIHLFTRVYCHGNVYLNIENMHKEVSIKVQLAKLNFLENT